MLLMNIRPLSCRLGFCAFLPFGAPGCPLADLRIIELLLLTFDLPVGGASLQQSIIF